MMKYIVCAGILLGGVDAVLGNRRGYGRCFRQAFEMIPDMAFSMAGILCLSNIIVNLAEKWLSGPLRFLHIDPSVLAGFLAIDMGGWQLAENLASNPAAGAYAGAVLSAGLGCTLVFTIPVGIGMVNPQDREYFSKGIVMGLAALPAAFITGSLLCGLTAAQFLLINILPLIVVAGCIVGLCRFCELTLKIFGGYVRLLKIVLTGGLMAGAIAHTLGSPDALGLMPLLDAMKVVCSIAVFLLGSLPVTLLLQRLLNTPLQYAGRKIGLDSASLTGLLASCVSPIPALALLKDMNPRGKLVNVAFMVSAASVLGAHLAFINSANGKLTGVLVVSKLAGGFFAACVALFLSRFEVGKVKFEN